MVALFLGRSALGETHRCTDGALWLGWVSGVARPSGSFREHLRMKHRARHPEEVAKRHEGSPQDWTERAIPILAGRISLEIADAREMKVVDLLTCAGELAALFDQIARFLPLLCAQRLEDVLVKR